MKENTTRLPVHAGIIESTLLKALAKSVNVLSITEIGKKFLYVTFQGNALRNANWHPGQKIQIMLGNWIRRTYTPVSLDPNSGIMSILVYRHGDGPGTRWADSLREGQECIIYGPGKSLDFNSSPFGQKVFFGDESSFGLFVAAQDYLTPESTTFLIEVDSARNVDPVIEYFGLVNFHLEEKDDENSHLIFLENRLKQLLHDTPSAQSILSGKSSSIQKINRELKAKGTHRGNIRTKAYWAPEKSGLD